MPVSRFMREYWQQKPLLIRGGFSNFRDPLEPDELAGLACESDVESRLVERVGAKRWNVGWGPFPESRFAKLGKRNWTLLVQEVNRWVPGAAMLLEPFTFIPNVRVDDVMVSFAAPGGGVGAHIDSYDVFLIQGQGQRRWRLGSKREVDPPFVPGLDLRILKHFAPVFDEIVNPGDVLYVPPGFAHEGTAVTPCLTYSVGFRAPRRAELWASFAIEAARRASDANLLVDPQRTPSSDPGAIPMELRQQVRTLVRSLDMSDDAIDRWYARFATMLKPEHPLPTPKRQTPLATVHTRLRNGAMLVRSEEVRFAWLPRSRGALWLYVGGHEIPVAGAAVSLAKHIARARRIPGETLLPLLKSRSSTQLLEQLLAMGAVEVRMVTRTKQ